MIMIISGIIAANSNGDAKNIKKDGNINNNNDSDDDKRKYYYY